MGVSVNVSVDSNFDTGQLDASLVRGINLATERGLAITSERVPLDIGTLVGTGAVTPATDPDEGAEITYDTPYAARLHEHPEYNFQGGRQGKYVEEPILEARDELASIIVAAVLRG